MSQKEIPVAKAKGRPMLTWVGKKPLAHPLTPLDLEAIRTELKARPEEERDILVVSLGIEHAARDWLAQYNQNRPINKLHLVELRSDRKSGGFLRHEPMTAEVAVKIIDMLGEELVLAFAPDSEVMQ